MKTRKNGISLIVLVITIVVMIILATAVILSLSLDWRALTGWALVSKITPKDAEDKDDKDND